ncbi:hypothetical protein GP486_000349 [Trichoglossum hirsutum]|uniref:Salicylate hydroxylase n=1 Tax=Trichoglossum hirsutum TaxID=265104 RepID=A0A9P8RTQ8_9PEZI|nr:hypothetical protein GP486_000349 [Trichoglossum hirsutum]
MSSAKKPLTVLIVGAGIAGLSTAIALRRAGHQVEVFEQSSFADEVGAAIQLPPNAMRTVVKWGFSKDRARLELCGAALTARADNLEPLYKGSFSHFSDKYGSMWYSSHRVDLHNELKLLATEENASGIPVKINLASKVADIGPRVADIYSGEVQNFVGIHPDEEQRREDFQASSSREYLLETYKDFNPVLLRVMEKVKDVKLWPLLHRPPLRTWHTERLLFIGDAAHPMLPHADQGQAGAQAIEDACALGLLLEGIESADVNSRLKLFEKVRIGRAGAVQIFSRYGQDQADKVKQEVEKIEGWKGAVPANQGEFHDWNFSWDVYSECQRALDDERLEKDNEKDKGT